MDRTLLIEQSPWITRLARNLVRDPAGAEDVVQETMLAALASPPRDASDERRLRAWLGRVAFNLANLSVRRNVRRRDREEDVARRESQASAADTVVRTSVLADLGEAVDDLAEPYRTAVELRYFEGLSTAEIARQTQASESAVRKRLWRARGQLRQTLDARHNGERTAWFEALAPLVALGTSPKLGGGPATAGAGPTSSLVPSSGLKAAALAAGLAGVVIWTAASGDARSPRLLHGVRAADARAAGDARTGTQAIDDDLRVAVPLDQDASPGGPASSKGGADGDTGRREVAATEESARPEAEPSAPGEGTLAISGSVLDLWGHPLGGLEVIDAGAPDRVLAHSGANGSFAFEVAELPITLGISGARHVGVRGERVEEGEEDWPVLLVAAPSVRLGGRVIDATGRPVPGASIDVAVDDRAFAEFPEPLDASELESQPRPTSAEGHFQLAAVPTGPGFHLRVRAPGFGVLERHVPEFDALDLEFVLEPTLTTAGVWSGVVVDRFHRPIPGALVSRDGLRTRTDDEGRFQLDAERGAQLEDDLGIEGDGRSEGSAGEDGIVVRKDGFPPRAVRLSDPVFEQGLTVMLDGAVEPIEGRVLDEESADTHRDWVVFVTLDEDRGRGVDTGPLDGAGLDGFTGSGEDGRLEGRLGEAPSSELLRSRGGFVDFGVPVDPQGYFRTFGAAGRSYRVLALERSTLTATGATHVRAGSRSAREVELHPLTAMDPSRPLRVVDAHGDPLAGARVQPLLELASEGQAMLLALAPRTSAADGRLHLFGPSDLIDPLDAARGPDPLEWDGGVARDSGPGSDSLEVEHPLVGRVRATFDPLASADVTLRVEAAPGLRLREFHGADAFHVLDEHGIALALRTPTGESTAAGLFGGSSSVLSVVAGNAGPATLAWYREGVEVGRQELSLVAGETLVVEPEKRPAAIGASIAPRRPR